MDDKKEMSEEEFEKLPSWKKVQIKMGKAMEEKGFTIEDVREELRKIRNEINKKDLS